MTEQKFDKKLINLKSVLLWAEDAWEADPTWENLEQLNKAREELRQYQLGIVGE